jgi:YegS/Rv2252/BmrU family lipid kinase
VWDNDDTDLSYQFCRNAGDGIAKARRAIERGCDVLVVCGGDGTVSTVGRALLGTDVALAVIPTGSGNGLARHFEIPLSPDKAAKALACGTVKAIDVGLVNGRLFLVTCSMAWDAALVRSFEKYRVRGILPYVFAGVQELIGYRPQDVEVTLDGGMPFVVEKPLVFTVANLTQYGGGARIAPHAEPDDGKLELVVVRRQDAAAVVAQAARFFDGTLDRIPEVMTRRFASMRVRRPKPSPVQMDGELVETGRDVEVTVRPMALKLLVPRREGGPD